MKTVNANKAVSSANSWTGSKRLPVCIQRIATEAGCLVITDQHGGCIHIRVEDPAFAAAALRIAKKKPSSL